MGGVDEAKKFLQEEWEIESASDSPGNKSRMKSSQRGMGKLMARSDETKEMMKDVKEGISRLEDHFDHQENEKQEFTKDVENWRRLKEKYIKQRGKIKVGRGKQQWEAEMEDIFVDLQIIQEERDSSGRDITEEHLCKPQDYLHNTGKNKHLKSYQDLLTLANESGRPSHLILMQGSAGTGKTTLLSRIAYDWARIDVVGDKKTGNTERKPDSSTKTKEIRSSWDKFLLLFVLDIRKFKSEESLEQAIGKQLLPGVDESRIAEVVSKLGVECLILLDGFDEMRKDVWESEDHALDSPLLESSFVIVTTRPHVVDRFCDRYMGFVQVQVSGFTIDDIFKYIEKFFCRSASNQPNLAVTLIQKIYEMPVLQILSSFPILLVMICHLWHEKGEEGFASTFTGLYEKGVQYLNKKPSPKTHTEKIEETVTKLGKAALAGLLENSVQIDRNKFDDEGVLRHSFEIGLCFEEEGACVDETYVTFIHKTFQEFCAAKYLCSLLLKDPSLFTAQIEAIHEYNVFDMEYMLRFSCGLSKEAADAILPHMIKLMCKLVGKYRVNSNVWRPLLLMIYEAEVVHGSIYKASLLTLLQPMSQITLQIDSPDLFEAVIHLTQPHSKNTWLRYVKSLLIRLWLRIRIHINYIANVLKCMSYLSYMILHSVDLVGELDATISVPQQSIQEIRIVNSSVVTNTLVRLMGYMESLKVVHLFDIVLTGKLSVNTITVCKSLTLLTVSCSTLDASSLMRLLGCMPSLARLVLSQVHIIGEVDRDLSIQLQSLKTFILSDNTIVNIDALLKYIGCMSKLQHIALCDVNLVGRLTAHVSTRPKRIDFSPPKDLQGNTQPHKVHIDVFIELLAIVTSFEIENFMLTAWHFPNTKLGDCLSICEVVALANIHLTGELTKSDLVSLKSVKIFDMSSCAIDAKTLVKCLDCMPSLEKVELRKTHLLGELNSNLSILLKSLRELSIDPLSVSSNTLINTMTCMPFLKTLILSNMHLTNNITGANILGISKSLRVFQLSWNLAEKPLALKPGIMVAFLNAMPSLESLHLNGIHIAGELPGNLRVQWKSLKTCSFYQCIFSANTMFRYLQCMPLLDHLTLEYIIVVGELNADEGPVCESLTFLHFMHSVVSSNTVLKLLQFMPALKRVILGQVTGEIDEIIPLCFSSIKQFSLCDVTVSMGTLLAFFGCVPEADNINVACVKILDDKTTADEPVKLQFVKKVTFSQVLISARAVIQLLGCIPMVESVEFENFDVTGDLSSVVPGICESLTVFTLHESSLSAITALWLLGSMPSVEQVFFQNVDLKGKLDRIESTFCVSVNLFMMSAVDVSVNTVMGFLGIMPNLAELHISGIRGSLPMSVCISFVNVKSFILSHTEFNISTLITFLGCMPSLENMMFSRIHITGELEASTPVQLKSLKRFTVFDTTVTGELDAGASMGCTRVKEYAISNGAISVNNFLKLISCMTSLETIVLGDVNLTGELDANVFPSCISLKTFKMFGSRGKPCSLHSLTLVRLLRCLPSVTDVILNEVELTGDPEKQAGVNCKSIKKFISENGKISVQTLVWLMHHMQLLESVHVTLTGDFVPCNTMQWKSVKDLKMSIVSMTKLDVLFGFLCCMPSLEKLMLGLGMLTGDVDESIVVQLKSLRELILYSPFKEQCVVDISSLLRLLSCVPSVDMVTLERIQLSGQIEPNLSEQCKLSSQVKSLYMSSMKVNEKLMVQFLACLPSLHTITSK